MGFRYFTSQHDKCPVCQGERKDCRHDGDLIFCRTESPSPLYRFIKLDAKGFGIYVEDKFNERQTQTYRPPREKRKDDREVVADSIRDRSYRELASQTKLDTIHHEDLLRRGLPADLIQKYLFRSIRPNQRVNLTNPKFPGIKQGYVRVRQYGYTIPVFDVDSKIISYQVRIEDEENKYLWSSSTYLNNGNRVSSHNEILELPLQVINLQTETLGLCEGTLKPIIASNKHGISFIGASGGNFLSSRRTLLKTLKRLNPKKIIIFPDSNFCKEDVLGNRLVLDKNKKIAHFLLDHGFNVVYGYWGQELDSSKGDIDEIDSYEELPIQQLLNLGGRVLSKLTPEETLFMAKMSEDGYLKMFQDELSKYAETPKKSMMLTWEQSEDREVKYTPGCLPEIIPPKTVYVFHPRHRTVFYQEAYRKGHIRVLDISGCGTGKSYTAGTMTAETFFNMENIQMESPEAFIKNNKLVYLTQQARNPATSTLEKNFTELESRHYAVVYDKATTTELGAYHRKRVTANDKYDELGNCHLADMFVAIRAKDIEENLCKSCPFFKQCKQGKGAGWSDEEDRMALPYGYEHQKINTLNTKSEIIASASGFNYKLMGNAKWAAIVDEYSQTLQPINVVNVTLNDYAMAITQLINYDAPFIREKVINVFTSILPYLQGLQSSGTHGFSDSDVRKLLPDMSVEEREKAVTQITNLYHDRMQVIRDVLKMGKGKRLTHERLSIVEHNWIKPFYEVWSGRVDGAFQLDKSGFKIYIRNQMMVETLNNMRFIVFQDATGTRSHLSKITTIPENEILVGKASLKEDKTMRVVQITGLGSTLLNRSKDERRRVEVIRRVLSDRHKKIGFIEWKKYALEGDLIHLVTGRGSNGFNNMDAVCSFGIPMKNLSALQQEYTTYTGKKPEGKDFSKYVNNCRSGELVQEMGRLREERREEDLIYYVVTDDNINWLKDIGYDLEIIEATSLSPEAGSKQDLIKWEVYKAAMRCIKEGEFSTKTKLSRQANVTVRQVNKLAEFTTLQNFYADQYLLIQQIISEAEQSLQSRPLDDIIDDIVNSAKPEEQEDIRDVLAIYMPGFLKAYVKDELQRDDTERDIVNTITSLADVYSADWEILNRYAKNGEYTKLEKKLSKLPQRVQQLWQEKLV